MSETSNFENSEHVRSIEKAVLGGLMLETERYDSVCLIISHNDFEGKDHQSIFQSMGELVENNKPLDPFTLSDKLDSRNLLQSTGGRDYLVELAQTSPTAANLEAYAELIRERSIRRKLQRINSEISELITNPQGRDSGGLLDEAESKIFALNDEASRTTNKIRSLEELIPLSIDMLNELSQKGPSLIGSSTGFKALDEKTQGLQKGDLIVVAGRPSMGKTSFAMNIAENFLVDEDVKGGILVFSLEMSAESLTTRLLASNAKIDQQRVRAGELSAEQLGRLMNSQKRLQDCPLYIDDSSLISPMEIRARARRTARQESNGLALIVVDYIQLMQLPGSNENRVNQISEISRSLKSLAKELNVPVIALSQLNRGVELRTDKRPMMADLRDSGAIEQDADLILFIYRDKVYNKETDVGNMSEVIIAKQRNGPIGKIPLSFLESFTRFENFSGKMDDFSSDDIYQN